MNNINITGYILDLPLYRKKLDKNEMECCFFVDCVEPIENKVCRIPVKASGQMADKCYASINVNTYVELSGSLFYQDKVMYIIPHQASFKQPKARTEMYISSTEYIKTYAPVSIMKKLSGIIKEDKKK